MGKGRRKPCVSPRQEATPPAQPTAAPTQGNAISRWNNIQPGKADVAGSWSSSFLPHELWRDLSNSEEMAVPVASVLQVLHGPLIKLQLDRRDEIAVVSAAGAVVVAWWKKLLHPPEEWAQQSLISRLCQSIRSQPSPSRLRQ